MGRVCHVPSLLCAELSLNPLNWVKTLMVIGEKNNTVAGPEGF